MRDLFLNRVKEGCRLSRTIGEERPEIYRIEAGSDLPLYPTYYFPKPQGHFEVRVKR